MAESISNFNAFWSQIVQPGDPQEVLFNDDAYLTITNVNIPEHDSSSNEPVRLLLHALTEAEDDPETAVYSDVLIATLLPGISEQQVVNIVLSPINVATFEIKGKYPLHVSGYLSSMS